MSGNKIKVSVLEINGVEENEGPAERLLQAIDVDVDDTTIASGFNDLQSILNFISQKDRNLDGGFANAVYTPEQCFDGGDANG